MPGLGYRDTRRVWTKKDGPAVRAEGVRSLKLPNPVFLLQQAKPFDVQTPEGLVSGKAGDYVAHDPISGHLWPIDADYAALHYRPAPEEQVA
jgi:hypothetical protein